MFVYLVRSLVLSFAMSFVSSGGCLVGASLCRFVLRSLVISLVRDFCISFMRSVCRSVACHFFISLYLYVFSELVSL